MEWSSFAFAGGVQGQRTGVDDEHVMGPAQDPPSIGGGVTEGRWRSSAAFVLPAAWAGQRGKLRRLCFAVVSLEAAAWSYVVNRKPTTSPSLSTVWSMPFAAIVPLTRNSQ